MTETEPAADSLLRQRPFALLWTGRTVSEVGTMVTAVAFPLVALQSLHASGLAVGMIGAASSAAWVLIGLPAGVWADRARKLPLMVGSDLARAVAMGSVPLAWALGVLTVAHLVVVALVIGIGTVLFEVASTAYLPIVVPRGRLVEANGVLQASSAGSTVVGPGLGGLLVQALGGPATLLADVASYLVSAACLTGIRQAEAGPARTGPTSLRGDLVAGLRYVLGRPFPRAIAASCAAANFGLAGFQTVLLIFLVRQLGVPAAAIGGLIAIASVGGLLGGISANRLARRLGDVRLLWSSAAVAALAGLLVPLATRGPGLFWYLAGTFGLNAAAVAFTVCVMSAIQTATPGELLARVTASIRLFTRGAMPFGALAGGALATAFSPRTALVVLVLPLALAPVLLRGSVAGQVRRTADLPAAYR